MQDPPERSAIEDGLGLARTLMLHYADGEDAQALFALNAATEAEVKWAGGAQWRAAVPEPKGRGDEGAEPHQTCGALARVLHPLRLSVDRSSRLFQQEIEGWPPVICFIRHGEHNRNSSPNFHLQDRAWDPTGSQASARALLSGTPEAGGATKA